MKDNPNKMYYTELRGRCHHLFVFDLKFPSSLGSKMLFHKRANDNLNYMRARLKLKYCTSLLPVI